MYVNYTKTDVLDACQTWYFVTYKVVLSKLWLKRGRWGKINPCASVWKESREESVGETKGDFSDFFFFFFLPFNLFQIRYSQVNYNEPWCSALYLWSKKTTSAFIHSQYLLNRSIVIAAFSQNRTCAADLTILTVPEFGYLQRCVHSWLTTEYIYIYICNLCLIITVMPLSYADDLSSLAFYANKLWPFRNIFNCNIYK